MKNKIYILPCNGDSAAGEITRLAAQELVLEGKAEWVNDEFFATGGEGQKQGIPSNSYIIVDGCERKCLFNEHLEEGTLGKYLLDLSDVGISPLSRDDIRYEDIQLAKDAIIAECKEKTKTPPIFISGCCCK